MIIDAHVHSIFPRTGSLEEAVSLFQPIVAEARANGIDKMCVSLPRRNMVKSNDVIFKLMEAYPSEVLGFCFIEPRSEVLVLKELKRSLMERKMVGVKLHIDCKATDPLLDPIMELVTEMGVPLLQHAWDKVTGNYEFESTPADVANLAERYPDAKIIMAHLYGARFKGILDVAPFENVYVDVSGGNPEAGVLEYAVEVLGPERIIFGSDVPGRDFSVQLSKVTGADLTDREKKLILSENMLALLGEDIS